ncbi:MAG: hypothetical protein IPP90_16575 [Gemmatimonadaceae bacterium]|nr:hypothetical protein [Gemmatimonadaceae bacterium]
MTTGDVVRVMESRDGWRRVVHADGGRGWLPAMRLLAIEESTNVTVLEAAPDQSTEWASGFGTVTMPRCHPVQQGRRSDCGKRSGRAPGVRRQGTGRMRSTRARRWWR